MCVMITVVDTHRPQTSDSVKLDENYSESADLLGQGRSLSRPLS